MKINTNTNIDISNFNFLNEKQKKEAVKRLLQKIEKHQESEFEKLLFEKNKDEVKQWKKI